MLIVRSRAGQKLWPRDRNVYRPVEKTFCILQAKKANEQEKSNNFVHVPLLVKQ